MKDTFFYLGIMATIIHGDLWQQLLFIVYLLKIKTYPLCKIICIQYNAISKTRKIKQRDIQWNNNTQAEIIHGRFSRNRLIVSYGLLP